MSLCQRGLIVFCFVYETVSLAVLSLAKKRKCNMPMSISVLFCTVQMSACIGRRMLTSFDCDSGGLWNV